jgi:8-oxo-dGTP pyrophosphatase MutT (NUDIX family)
MQIVRDGWGRRHPDLASVLARCRPAAEREESWWDGQLPLRVQAFTGACEVPDELITSVRCIVITDDGVVRCTNRDGSHLWPGGRREPGESLEQTAIREVLEETGWRLDPHSLVALGWLRFEYQSERPADWPFPHPDFVQLLYTARAVRRDVAPDGREWSDTDGWEQSSDVVSWSDLDADALTQPFLDLLRSTD